MLQVAEKQARQKHLEQAKFPRTILYFIDRDVELDCPILPIAITIKPMRVFISFTFRAYFYFVVFYFFYIIIANRNALLQAIIIVNSIQGKAFNSSGKPFAENSCFLSQIGEVFCWFNRAAIKLFE